MSTSSGAFEKVKGIFIIFLLIFITPVGLILMWFLAKWSKKVKLVLTFVFLILMILELFTIIFKNFVVVGNSMSPALNEGQKIVINRLDKSPDRGDIIVVGVDQVTSSIKPTVRRVVGLPNEEVEIKGGRVFINDEILNEPYLGKVEGDINQESLSLSSSQYFVLADNRDVENYKGRDIAMWSIIPKNFILGKYLFSY